jgi:glycosyltransferase involved in cell wall biosynthesis
MIYVGQWSDFGVRFALSALHAGIRRVHIASGFGINRSHQILSVVVYKGGRAILYRLLRSRISRKAFGRFKNNFFLRQYLYSRKVNSITQLADQKNLIKAEPRLKKISLVGGSLGPGGAERQLTSTLLGLSARGYQNLNFLHHAPMHKPNDFFLNEIVNQRIPFCQVHPAKISVSVPSSFELELRRQLSPMGTIGDEIAAYARYFYVHRPEIVHSWLDHMNVTAGLAAHIAGVPKIILSCRSLSPINFAFAQPYMRPIYRRLAVSPRVTFLNNSEAGARDYERWIGMPSLQFRVLHNGFNFSKVPSEDALPKLRSSYRSRLGIPQDVPVVGAVMRMSEEKRPLLWLEIAKRVAGSIPKAHFILVGHGPMYDEVVQRAMSIMPGKVHFPGHERDSLLAMSAMDLFLLTSRIEGLPNVLIEAQSIGLVPVAIKVGGVGETLIDGRTGWLLRDSDVAPAAAKIEELLSNSSMRKSASALGRAFVRQKFDLNAMIDQTEIVYAGRLTNGLKNEAGE